MNFYCLSLEDIYFETQLQKHRHKYIKLLQVFTIKLECVEE